MGDINKWCPMCGAAPSEPYRPRWHFGAGFFKGFGFGITLRPTEYDIVIGPWMMWVFYE